MDFEQELRQFARGYTDQGYDVVLRPHPEDLPLFAKDFKVEIVGKRAHGGVLVSVKKNRQEMAADKEMPRYAEITAAQPGWRYDFAILAGDEPGARRVLQAQEFSTEDIRKTMNEAEAMVRQGFVRPAVITAWSAFEAAMRRRLRADGEEASWGTVPRQLVSDLAAAGVFNRDEFLQLERLYQIRNQIVHGFASPASDEGAVQFLTGLTRRLLDERQETGAA